MKTNALNGNSAVIFQNIFQTLTGPSGAYQTIIGVRNIVGTGQYHTFFASPANSDFSIRGGGSGSTYTDGPNANDWTNRSWYIGTFGRNSSGSVTLNFNFSDYNGSTPVSTNTFALLYNPTSRYRRQYPIFADQDFGNRIIDVQGRIVSRMADAPGSVVNIPVDGLQKGVYFAEVLSGQSKFIRTFIKN
ncbi:MAG TPA: T9SS type A sorting domain-containing protein [Puia sp.]|nr:T9SS type A sorting domain-containing protein [Puia sp.]